MKVSGWGRYPVIEAKSHYFRKLEQLRYWQNQLASYIPRGNARSYGDSALNTHMISSKQNNCLLSFDNSTGVLKAQSGVQLADIVEVFVSRGWFLSITPGTKFITLGGAIASDVHGKNHHVSGCFSECVISFTLLLPNQTLIKCSHTHNVALFRATCGGMGLTGVIVEAEIQLQKINSCYIQQITIKTDNLDSTFAALQENAHTTYSVAWLDCLAQGNHLGRGIVSLGEFSEDADLQQVVKKKLSIACELPNQLLNKFTVKMFNQYYFHKHRQRKSQQKVSLDAFFYPLDSIEHWNRIYGKKGFLQYQFILPLSTSHEGLEDILTSISHSGMASFLAVLKLYGPQNKNYLSFPIEGYSLALDFKIQPKLWALLEHLDEKVMHYGGRLYLAKDARMSQRCFAQGYPRKAAFRKLRKKYHMMDKIQSKQSQRLGI